MPELAVIDPPREACKSAGKAILIAGVLLFLAFLDFGGCGEDLGHDRAIDRKLLRVGTSGDYVPFSFETGKGELKGFEIDLAKGFARDHGYAVEFVRFRWPELLKDLQADRFDVAMSGVTVREDRSLAGRFAVPVTTSGALVILPKNSLGNTMAELDRVGVRIGVNAGGHLERVTRKAFHTATIVTSPDNQSLPDMLKAGTVDALVTDTLEAPHWLTRLEGARALPPFTQDRKAWLVRPDEDELARQLDSWLLDREADGTLVELRQKHSAGETITASPLMALLAAMDERLFLMPAVAESKRRLGKPVEDRKQEARVLETAWLDVSEQALRLRKAPPDEETVLEFFSAQIEAAKAIQYRVMAETPAVSDPPDLVQDLRPALNRISGKINRLLVLSANEPEPLDSSAIHLLTSKLLGRHGLSSEHLASMAKSLDRLWNSVDK